MTNCRPTKCIFVASGKSIRHNFLNMGY